MSASEFNVTNFVTTGTLLPTSLSGALAPLPFTVQEKTQVRRENDVFNACQQRIENQRHNWDSQKNKHSQPGMYGEE